MNELAERLRSHAASVAWQDRKDIAEDLRRAADLLDAMGSMIDAANTANERCERYRRIAFELLEIERKGD